MKRFSLCFLALGFVLTAAKAEAGPILASDCITNNSVTNCNTGENQLTVEVLDLGSNMVGFKFWNVGANASSITDVYFDDSLDSLIFSSFQFSSGVSFSAGCSPGDPPGANGFTDGFCADSTPPAQPNGVNPGEWLITNFTLAGGFTYNAILGNLGDGDLRIAYHVQGFANGGSESFMTNPPSPVPEPGTWMLFGSGLIALAVAARKRRTKNSI